MKKEEFAGVGVGGGVIGKGSVMEVHHPVCILALGSGQRLLYRLESGLGL